MEHAAYLAEPDCKAEKKDLTPSTAPSHDDPLSRHHLSYLSGGGGSGKTTRAIERSSSSAREIPSSSPRTIAWPKRCGPGASRPRPSTASSNGVARRSGRLKGWGQKFILHSAPPHIGDFPRLARGSRRPGHLLWRPGTAAPYRRRNAPRFAPRGCTATCQLL